MTVYVVLGTLLVGLIYFALTATGLALLLSPAVGLVGFVFFRLIDPEGRGRAGYLRVLCAAGGGTVLGAAASTLLGVTQTRMWDWIGVVIATTFATAIYSLAGRSNTNRCVLCKAPSGSGTNCPRCGDWVCARPTCWTAKFARCTRCHERQIVIFPIADKWWDARLGRRVMKGECTSCFTEAHETDLRECGQCHWPMCRRCWDYYNGVCQRCEWAMPDIPARLAPFLRRPKTTRGLGRAAARHHPPRQEPAARVGVGPAAALSEDTTIARPTGRKR